MDLLIVELGRDEIFGDFTIVQEFLGNSTALVERLVPTAGFEAFTRSQDTTSYDDDSFECALEIPHAATWAQTRFCFTISQAHYYWLRLIPFAMIAALTALK